MPRPCGSTQLKVAAVSGVEEEWHQTGLGKWADSRGSCRSPTEMGDLDLGVISGEKEKWADLAQDWKYSWTGSANGLDVRRGERWTAGFWPEKLRWTVLPFPES